MFDNLFHKSDDFHADHEKTADGESTDQDQQGQGSTPTSVTALNAKPLSADSSVAEWLDHPVGGAIFRDMLEQSGQDEKVLRPVRRMSLKRLIPMSKGQFTQEIVDDMVGRASSGGVPEAGDAAAAAIAEAKGNAASKSTEFTPASVAAPLPEWQEKITTGRFAGKTVIVTGAGSGIGRATASRVAREGGRVIAVDILQERLDEFKAELVDADIVVVTGDITKDETIAKIVKTAGDTVDCLANVAGIMDNMTPLHEMTDEVWDRVMGVNLVGMMKLSRAVLPSMLKRQAGTIVNVGSEASLKASAAGAAYTTSKHAVAGLTKSIAYMYGANGIRANMVAPGPVMTNIEAKFDSKLGEERVNLVLATIPDAATGDMLAASITYLLSDDSVNVNGALLPSDGGWSVQ
jgi:NAD(P)-dependent dehydrogenase (short-subunit alcohol dehydrogenase family)